MRNVISGYCEIKNQVMGKLNCLLATPRAPWPTKSGGQQRTYLLAEALRKLGRVQTLLVDPKPMPSASELSVMTDQFGLIEDGLHLTKSVSKWGRRLFPGQYEFGRSNDLISHISETAGRCGCDTIIFRYLSIAARSTPRIADGIARFVDIDDVPSLRAVTEWRAESGIKRLGKRWIAKRISVAQSDAISRIDGGWVSCQEDLDLIADSRFSVLPNIPLDAIDGPANPRLCNQDETSRTVLFVGAMSYPINVQAVTWFVEKVWPIVRYRQPAAVFQIAGGGLTRDQKQTFSQVPGVLPLGFVDNLSDAYRKCAMSIVPINAGAGTKIKVLESLRYGRTVVLTKHSLRGYHDVLKSGRDLFVADEPTAMATAILDLIEAPHVRAEMAHSGQRIVNDQFGFDRFINSVADKFGR